MMTDLLEFLEDEIEYRMDENKRSRSSYACTVIRIIQSQYITIDLGMLDKREEANLQWVTRVGSFPDFGKVPISALMSLMISSRGSEESGTP